MQQEVESLFRVKEMLCASHLFGILGDAVLDDLVRHLELRDVSGGSLVFREGEPSDCMVIVVAGRLRVSRRDANGALLLYNEICPGESVGETGLILCQVRTADVTAVRDSTIAILNRAHFEALIQLRPVELNRVFSQAIFNHLRHKQQVTNRRLAQSFAVIPLHPDADSHALVVGLSKAFAGMGRTHYLTRAALQDIAEAGGDSTAPIEQLEKLERRFDYLIMEAEPDCSALTQRAFRQADQLIFVAASGQTPEIREIEKRLSTEPGFSMKRQHLVILHPKATRTPDDTASWQQGRQLERVYALRNGRSADFAHLARFLTGNAVGVVLGGGGARGFAHIGALRALQECGVPIDLVGGNSMGALIGAQFASDVPLEEILERTQRFALGGEHPTLPFISLLGGRRIERDLRRLFENTTISNLWRPYFAAACNLTHGCTTVQDSGPLWRAVLASNSPAGLLPPVLHEGQLLVDGAILDNVPVGAMRMRLGTPNERRRGNGTVIAIDVDVREDLCVDPALIRLSPLQSIKHYFSPRSAPLPGIGDILYRASHIGSLHQRGQTIALADHYLEPPVSGFALMDYRRAAEIVDVGYRYANEQIEKWEKTTLSR